MVDGSAQACYNNDMLDDFLSSAEARTLGGKELRAFFRDLEPEAHRPHAPPHESAPLRIMTMWRVVRVLGRITGLVAEDEMLNEATDILPDPWENPFKPRIGADSSLKVMRKNRTNTALQAWSAGLPLLPPRNDPDALERWCDAALVVVRELSIRGDIVKWFVDPRWAPYNDVNQTSVLWFEEMLLSEMMERVLDTSTKKAEEFYVKEYGLRRKEIQSAIKLAKSTVLMRSSESLEEKRAMRVAQLEGFIARARESMNMADELKALKQLVIVEGLNRTAPEDTAAEILGAMRKVAQIQEPIIDAESRPVLEYTPPPSEEIKTHGD